MQVWPPIFAPATPAIDKFYLLGQAEKFLLHSGPYRKVVSKLTAERCEAKVQSDIAVGSVETSGLSSQS